MTSTYRQPLPNTIEALDDAGLEAIRANFDAIFRALLLGDSQFSEDLVNYFAALATTGYVKTTSAGVLSVQTIAIPATDGGTGLTTYAIGDLLYASAATTLSKLADIATGNALISGGVGVAPSWGKIGLTTHVSGTLPIANGGTNATSFTNTRIPYFDGTRFVDDADFTFVTDTLTITKVVAPTSVSTPSLISTGALTITPVAGSNLNIALSTTGDFTVNANQLYVDTSTGSVGIGSSSPEAASRLHINSASGTAKQSISATDGTNDSWINFETNNNEWSFGIDKSDSNKFKLSNGDTLGSGDVITSTPSAFGLFTSPSSRFHVANTAGTCEVRITANNGTNDPWIHWETNNNEWSMGMDKSATDQPLTLSNASVLGTNNVLSITGSLFAIVNVRVGIGTISPANSAALDVNSTTGAVILSRMTSTERDALSAVNGMIIYNTTTAKFQGYEAGAWNNFSIL